MRYTRSAVRALVRVVPWAVVAVLAAGCPRAAPEPDAPQSPDPRTPFFWRVDPGDGVAPSYLLGTFHIGVDPDEVYPPTVWPHLEGARVVVLEVDLAVPEALGLGRKPPGESLRDEMGAEDWQTLLDALDVDDEATADELAGYEAWVIVTQVIQSLVPETRSIDDVVQARAKEAGVDAVFLETLAFQEALFREHMKPKTLLALLGQLDRERARLAEQAAAFKSGDEQLMIEQSIDTMTSDAARAELLDDRNERWMNVLVPEIRRGGAFVAVGTSHLIGDRGVVALLRARGFRVERENGVRSSSGERGVVQSSAKGE